MDNLKTQETLRNLWGILNELAPENFDKIVKEATDLSLDTEERLKAAVEMIFDNFLSEQSYDVDHAIMCFRVLMVNVKSKNSDGWLKFRSLLLSRCQSEIQRNHLDGQIQTKQRELNTANYQADRDLIRSELEELRNEAHHRFVGSMKLIGELFNIDVLREALMHVCMMKLLNDHKEESLEGLCMLLQTAGQKLDSEKAKLNMDEYFSQIERMTRGRQMSDKVRMMLQDVLDLRKENWVRGGQDVTNDPSEDASVESETAGIPPSSHPRSLTPPTRLCCPSCLEKPTLREEGRQKSVVRREQKKAAELNLRQEVVSETVGQTRFSSEEELKSMLDRVLLENSNSQQIIKWIKTHLSEGQVASSAFVRALMTSVIQSVVVFCGFHKVDHWLLMTRSAVLRKYLDDPDKQLEALKALQALMVRMEHPKDLLNRLFVSIFDEDIIEEEVLCRWRFSKDLKSQQAKDTALRSVQLFFAELRNY